MIFLNKRDPQSFVEGLEGEGVGLKTPGCARGPRRTPMGCAHLEAHLRMIPMPKNTINRETISDNPRSEVLLLQASIAMKNQSRPRSGTLPEGEIITSGQLHHPGGHHDEDGVVHQ